MSNEELINFLNTTFKGHTLSNSFGQTSLTVESIHWLSTMKQLHKALSGPNSMLVCLSVIDRESNGLELFAHVRDTIKGGELVVKTTLPNSEQTALEIDSLCSLWQAAELMEDEVFDLFGIRFTHHPNLRRIMLDNDFVGYPLRKDFKQTE